EGNEAEWTAVLARHSFKDIPRSLRLLQEFVQGPGYVHVSPRTVDLARELVARLLALCPRPGPDGRLTLPDPALSDPDRVLARLDSYIAAYGARATLYETWTRHPSVFGLLLRLFDRSEFLAEIAIRTPDLVDDLEMSGYLRRRKA